MFDLILHGKDGCMYAIIGSGVCLFFGLTLIRLILNIKL